MRDYWKTVSIATTHFAVLTAIRAFQNDRFLDLKIEFAHKFQNAHQHLSHRSQTTPFAAAVAGLQSRHEFDSDAAHCLCIRFLARRSSVTRGRAQKSGSGI